METVNHHIISIIVPVYKVENYLRRCIDSILNQTYKDFELILVDDGSPDNCPLICEEYAKNDNRIIVIHKENGGLSSARNAGLDYVLNNSSSQYISFVDSDDYIDPFYLEKLLYMLVIHDCDVSCCNGYIVQEGEIVIPPYKLNDYLVTTELEFFTMDGYEFKNLAWGKLYRKRLFEAVRYPVGRTNEDSFVIHRLIGQCHRIVVFKSYLYYYVRHKGSITSAINNLTVNKDFLDIYLDRLKYYTNEHYVDELSFLNFVNSWRELKHCLVNRIVPMKEYKDDVRTLRYIYIRFYKNRKKFAFTNILFLYAPNVYLHAYKLKQLGTKKNG